MSDKAEVTQLLKQWKQGHDEVGEELMPAVMNELKAIARQYLSKERSDHTLQSTALVSEAYLRLIDQKNVDWQNRAHFFAIASTMMRRILVDHSRARLREKRGDGAIKVSLEPNMAVGLGTDLDLIVLDDALRELAGLDPRQVRVVEMRFFAGLTVEETANAMEISERTVKREWRMARAWLYQKLKRPDE